MASAIHLDPGSPPRPASDDGPDTAGDGVSCCDRLWFPHFGYFLGGSFGSGERPWPSSVALRPPNDAANSPRGSGISAQVPARAVLARVTGAVRNSCGDLLLQLLDLAADFFEHPLHVLRELLPAATSLGNHLLPNYLGFAPHPLELLIASEAGQVRLA